MMIQPVYEDNHLLVLNKPAGLLTQPSGTQEDSLEQQAKQWLKQVHQKQGNVFLHAVHRLDKPASGIVVFAKTSKALSRLNSTIRAKETRKIYWAWVEGNVKDNEGVLKNMIYHDDFHAKIVDSQHPDGQLAILKFRVLKRKKESTLLEIHLETGRYHQIRLQLSAIGHPIYGDEKYGSSHKYLPGTIALHHKSLQLPHPISKILLTFDAEPSAEFLALINKKSISNTNLSQIDKNY